MHHHCLSLTLPVQRVVPGDLSGLEHPLPGIAAAQGIRAGRHGCNAVVYGVPVLYRAIGAVSLFPTKKRSHDDETTVGSTWERDRCVERIHGVRFVGNADFDLRQRVRFL